MRLGPAAIAVAWAGMAAAGARAAETPERPRALVVHGVLGLVRSFDESRTVHLFQERGTIDTTYRGGLGPGAELGLQYGLRRRLGIQAAFGASSRSVGARYAARLPHPLYLDAHRRSEGSIDALSYFELAGHVGLGYTGHTHGLAYTLFAGPSLYCVRAELIERADTLERYPYDEVTVTLPTAKTSRLGPGVHAGASLHRPIGAALSLDVQMRYGYGRVVLAPNGDDRTRVHGSGPQLALGLRWAY